MLIERGFDDFSSVGIATIDIRHYYDSIDVPASLYKLKANLHEPGTAFAQATLRTQNSTPLRIERGPEALQISIQARGSLIGSHVAVALARVPILDCLQMLRERLQHLGFPIADDKRLAIAPHVDNIFAVATTGKGAVSMLNLVE